MTDFFISYNKADRRWAEWIAWELEQAGHSVTVQAWDFHPGGNIPQQMHKAIQESERTIAVLSPEYLAADYTMPEWGAAFFDDPKGEQRKLVPVRVRECEPTGLLKPIVYIDLVGKTESEARENLRDGVNPPARPATKPIYPTGAKQPKRFPGDPPSVWSVRWHRNPHFLGRDELLMEVRGRLLAGGKVAVATGTGGVGKTQLAAEYAYRYANEYDVVWWFRAETMPTLTEDFSALAGKLGLQTRDAVPIVLDWLRRNSDWLLIFDSAGAPSDYEELLPQGDGHLIVTTRNQHWVDSIEIRVLARPDAIAFLQKCSGRKENDAADKLCEAVGDLPLALEHAAAYIRETRISIAEYLKNFGAYFKVVDEKVRSVLRPSFERLGQESPQALDLLSVMAFYAPDDIPKSLLRSHINDPVEFNDAIRGLLRYSLVSVREESVSVHRLVQGSARERLADPGKYAETAMRQASGAFRYKRDDVSTWASSASHLPHVMAAARMAESLAVAPKETARVLNEAGLYLLNQASNLAFAEEALKRALAISEKVYGAGDPEVAVECLNLGIVFKEQGRLEEAKQSVERALGIVERAYGKEHRDFALYSNHLGTILRHQGDLPGARKLLETALAVDEKLNHESLDVAGDCNNLSLILLDQNDLKSAKVYAERALKIGEKIHGKHHPKIAVYVLSLGAIYQRSGDLATARACAERSLKIDEESYGPDHFEVAVDAGHLGSILKAAGDREGARRNLERSLAIFAATVGPDHYQAKRVGDQLRHLEAESNSAATS